MELVVVLAILALFIGFGAVQVDSVFGYSAKEARSKLYTSLESLQTSCLSKMKETVAKVDDAPIYMEIYEQNQIHYLRYVEYGTETKIKLGPKRIKIMYSLQDDESDPWEMASFVPIESSTPTTLKISYNRSTGGFLPLDDVAGEYVRRIYISGGRKSYILRLMPKTGKIVMIR